MIEADLFTGANFATQRHVCNLIMPFHWTDEKWLMNLHKYQLEEFHHSNMPKMPQKVLNFGVSVGILYIHGRIDFLRNLVKYLILPLSTTIHSLVEIATFIFNSFFFIKSAEFLL